MINYTPVIKGKNNDLKGLHEHALDSRIIPIIEFTNSKIKFDNLPHAFYYDTLNDLKLQKELSTQFKHYFKKTIPVYHDSASITKDEEFCIRYDVQNPINLDDLQYENGVLLIDFKDVSSVPSYVFSGMADSLKPIIELDWKYISVLGTSIPKSMSGVTHLDKFQRKELELFKVFRKAYSKIHYGDYCTVHPEGIIEEYDPKIMQSSAKIKYTLDDAFLIFKGKSLTKNEKGYSQFNELSLNLVNSEHYYGDDFSDGDGFIRNCSQLDGKGTGNQGTWIWVSISHHIAVVKQQLANFPDS